MAQVKYNRVYEKYYIDFLCLLPLIGVLQCDCK